MKIAFIYYDFSSFVKQDYEILSKHFAVEKVSYRRPKDIFKIAQVIFNSDLTYSWFASGHSFIAVLISKMLNKRSMVVAGGYDVAFVPEMNYGQYTQGMDKRIYADYVLKNADIILAVSKFTESEVLAKSKPQMIKVIYNGINTEKFSPGSEKKNLVITVASGTKNVIRLKGIEAFARAAEHIPDAKFLVLGLSDNDREILQAKYPSPNLEFCGYMSQRDLIKCYQKARVYCQLSYRESFGVALAEAMACGCVPVVTERAALPEVVGNTGIYVPYDDEEATAKAIEEALRSDKGKKAREMVESHYSGKKRESELLKAIKMIAK